MATLYNFGPKPLGKYSLPMPMAKLYNSKASRVSGTTDHAPLTSYMHHFISGTKIPHS